MTGVVHQIGRDLCRSRRKSVRELLHRLVIDIPRIQLGLSITPRRPSAFHSGVPDLVDVTRASVDQHIQLILIRTVQVVTMGARPSRGHARISVVKGQTLVNTDRIKRISDALCRLRLADGGNSVEEVILTRRILVK